MISDRVEYLWEISSESVHLRADFIGKSRIYLSNAISIVRITLYVDWLDSSLTARNMVQQHPSAMLSDSEGKCRVLDPCSHSRSNGKYYKCVRFANIRREPMFGSCRQRNYQQSEDVVGPGGLELLAKRSKGLCSGQNCSYGCGR